MNAKKKTTFLNIAIFIVLISGSFYFMNDYLIGYIKTISNEIVEAKRNRASVVERNKKIDEVRKNYNDIENDMGMISDTFVKKDYEEVGKMFMELESIATMYKIDLTKDPSSMEEKKIGDNISMAYFNMKTSGEYDNLMKFLLYLDNFKYYINLNNVEIASGATGTEDGKSISNVEMRAELIVYLQDK